VNDLSNSLASPENSKTDLNSAGGGRMLVTILLLICTLVLTSIMMIHYGVRMQGSEEGIRSFSWADLKPKGIETKLPISSNSGAGSVIDDTPITEKEGINDKFGKLLQAHSDQVRWPKLKVTGLGSSQGGGGDFAIINGNQLHPGQTTKDGITLIEVRAHDIIVEYVGQQRSFPVDLKD
jgi:hypothetical protein